VLRKDGTLWLNLGDSYATSQAGNKIWGDGVGSNKAYESGDIGLAKRNIPPGLKPKDLCGIPWRVALALQADGWWLRSDIIWAKPNPMPESVTDRPTKTHEYVFLLTKSAKYFYDADAVREPHADFERQFRSKKHSKKGGTYQRDEQNKVMAWNPNKLKYNPAGRNLRSVWTIPTEPTPEAHFATFPEKLVIPCIKAGTSEKGCCPECGAPWVRMVEKGELKVTSQRGKYDWKSKSVKDGFNYDAAWEGKPGQAYESKTIGWNPSCCCYQYQSFDGEDPKGEMPIPIPCTVLDPFVGSGKTLIVAKKFGRKAIGIELNPEYCEMPLKKISQDRLF